MPSLEYVPPSSAEYPLAPNKYAALLAALKTNPGVSNSIVSGNTGQLTFDKITFTWSYDGATTLTVTITEDHNWEAKLMGNEAIFGELNSKLIATI